MIRCSSIKTILKDNFQYTIKTFLLLLLFTPLVACTSISEEIPSSVLPSRKIHYLSMTDLADASQYWNTAWAGKSSRLYNEIQVAAIVYLRTNQYIPGKKDCNDMAVDLWQELNDKGIKSIIVVGNIGKSYETFVECNHAWLMVYSGEGSAAAIDLACTKVYTWEDVRSNSQIRQYWEGFVYEKPTDLLADFHERW